MTDSKEQLEAMFASGLTAADIILCAGRASSRQRPNAYRQIPDSRRERASYLLCPRSENGRHEKHELASIEIATPPPSLIEA
jgi:hypothetical protein